MLAPNAVVKNPYMADAENSVHNDSYNSNVTAAVLPLGIFDEMNKSHETLNPMAPTSAFYDTKQNMITPLLGGVAIVDMSGDTITRKGSFIPKQHDAESGYDSVQFSYSFVDSDDNIYDANWMKYGNEYIAPGVERVDIVQDGGEYTAKKVWLRDDIRDTSMIKLSTATGYLYGYWQNLDTGMWCYEVLDFDTGETVLETPVSNAPAYNNMGAGMIADVKGNALYCPTDAMYMMKWQDVFVYLPDGGKLSPFDMERYHLTDTQLGGLDAASYLMKVDLGDAEPGTLALRVNGLGRYLEDYKLYWQDADGNLQPFTDEWTLCSVGGIELNNVRLDESAVYEIRFDFADDSEFLVDESVSVILTK